MLKQNHTVSSFHFNLSFSGCCVGEMTTQALVLWSKVGIQPLWGDLPRHKGCQRLYPSVCAYGGRQGCSVKALRKENPSCGEQMHPPQALALGRKDTRSFSESQQQKASAHSHAADSPRVRSLHSSQHPGPPLCPGLPFGHHPVLLEKTV